MCRHYHTHIDIHIYLTDRVLFMLHHIHEKERFYVTEGTCFRPVHNEEEEILREYKLSCDKWTVHKFQRHSKAYQEYRFYVEGLIE